jgi:membrane-associated phospholipid phosphatase
MPSQHVGIAWLMALYAFQFKRWLGILMTVFTLAIMVGSVILGWHYAVDGYLGVIVVSFIWLGSGFVLRRKALNVQA